MWWIHAWKEVKMKKLEVVRLDVKEKDIYRAFIPCRIEIGAKTYIEDAGFKVKKILKIEIVEERFGDYVYFKGEKRRKYIKT